MTWKARNRWWTTPAAGFFLLAAALSACTPKKPASDGPSTVSIRMPDARTKLSAMSGFDFSNACFAAVLVVPEKLPPKEACEVQGTFQGFVGQAGEMTFTVDRGSGRILEIFAYLADSDSDCQTQTGFGDIPRDKIVRVGKYGPFETNSPDMAINIQLEAPASASVNVATQGEIDKSCLPKGPPASGSAGVTLGHARLSGGPFVIDGTLTSVSNETKLQGGSFQIQLSRRPE